MKKHDVFKCEIENVEIQAIVLDIIAKCYNAMDEFETIYLCYGANMLFTLTEIDYTVIGYKVIAKSVSIEEIDNDVKLYNLI